MFKLGSLVQSERTHLKDLYIESQEQQEESKSKLHRFQQELARRRQKSH